MDRTEFFKMAQKVAVYTNRCRDLSKPLLDDCIVVYEGIKYYPQYDKVGYDEFGKVINIAILHDLYANSITDVDLEKVIKYEQTRNNSFDKA